MASNESIIENCEYICRNADTETIRIVATFITGVRLRVEKQVIESYLLQPGYSPAKRSYGHH
jgi:hypothetical protein